MNKEWSELNKTMQAQIKKKGTYRFVKSCILRQRAVNECCNDEICENDRHFHEQTFQE